MLKDVLFLTKNIFDEALIKEENLLNPKRVYDVFRSLEEVISDVKLVSNHYLALDFTEEYLQNSSLGEPIDKWRKFFNKDLEQLNESVKKYLLLLAYLNHSFEEDSYVHKIYNSKTYYSFVRDNYNIGFVQPCKAFLHLTSLKTDTNNMDRFYIFEHQKIDLSIFEARVGLKNKLNEINEELNSELEKLKDYIFKRYTIDDLLGKFVLYR